MRRLVWPLKDYEARTLLASYSLFCVQYSPKIKWSRFQDIPSTDVLVVKDEPLGCAIGYIIADGKFITDDTYTDKNILTLRHVIANATPVTSPVICRQLKRIPLEERTCQAVLNAALNESRQLKIVEQEATIITKRRNIWPHPIELLEQCVGHSIDAIVHHQPQEEDPWYLSVDACHALSIWPRLIGRREIVLKSGRALVPKHIFMSSIPRVVTAYLMRLARDDRLLAWIETTESSTSMSELDPYQSYVATMRSGIMKRKRRLSDSVIQGAGAPPCIQLLMSRGTTTPWKNDERYQLAYVINSLAEKREADAALLAQPYVEFMEHHNMGKERISKFTSQLKPRYLDKRLCKFRGNLQSGIICPFSGGSHGVKVCIQKRKGIYIDPESATIADIWAYSE